MTSQLCHHKSRAVGGPIPKMFYHVWFVNHCDSNSPRLIRESNPASKLWIFWGGRFFCKWGISGTISSPFFWLLVWNILYFFHILGIIFQVTNSYFSEGWRKTTNQPFLLVNLDCHGRHDQVARKALPWRTGRLRAGRDALAAGGGGLFLAISPREMGDFSNKHMGV